MRARPDARACIRCPADSPALRGLRVAVRPPGLCAWRRRGTAVCGRSRSRVRRFAAKDFLPPGRRPPLALLSSQNLAASRNTTVAVPGVSRRSHTGRLAATRPKVTPGGRPNDAPPAHCCFPGEEGQARGFAAGHLSRCVDGTHFPQYRGEWAHQPHIVGCGGDGIARDCGSGLYLQWREIVVLMPHPTAMLPADILRPSPQTATCGHEDGRGGVWWLV